MEEKNRITGRYLETAKCRTIISIETKDCVEIREINDTIDRSADQGLISARITVIDTTAGHRIAWYFKHLGYDAKYDAVTKYLSISWE